MSSFEKTLKKVETLCDKLQNALCYLSVEAEWVQVDIEKIREAEKRAVEYAARTAYASVLVFTNCEELALRVESQVWACEEGSDFGISDEGKFCKLPSKKSLIAEHKSWREEDGEDEDLIDYEFTLTRINKRNKK